LNAYSSFILEIIWLLLIFLNYHFVFLLSRNKFLGEKHRFTAVRFRQLHLSMTQFNYIEYGISI